MAKNASALLAAVSKAATEPVAAPSIEGPQPAPVPGVGRRKFERPSRSGTKFIAGHFDPLVARQLRMLAVEEDTTVQALLAEALDLLFVKKNRPLIGDIVAKRG